MPKYLLSYLLLGAVYVVRTAGRWLPYPVFYGVLRLAGRGAAHLLRRERNIAKAQIQFALRSTAAPQLRDGLGKRLLSDVPATSLSDARLAELLSAACFVGAAESAGDTMLIPKLLPATEREYWRQDEPRWPLGFTAEGQEIVRELIAGKKPALALSGHIGPFELLAAFHAHYGCPISVVGRVPNYATLSRALDEVRASYGVQVIWRDDPRSARKILEVFRTGRTLAVLLDQDTALPNRFGPFFGQPAGVPYGAIQLALKTGAVMLTSYIVRESTLHYRVISERLCPPEGTIEEQTQAVVEEFNRRTEQLICRYPEQWVWWHRRWRREPGVDYNDGATPLRRTDEYLHWLAQLRPS